MNLENTLAISVAAIAVLGGLAAFVRVSWRELRKLSRVTDAFTGHPAQNGIPAAKGVLERITDQDTHLSQVAAVVDKVSLRQDEISRVATDAAEAVSQVLGELSNNGGTSTKDAAEAAVRAAHTAAEQVGLVLATSARTEALLRRHMANGTDVMATGVHNDRVLIEALQKAGIQVDGYLPFPDVDTGSEDVVTL